MQPINLRSFKQKVRYNAKSLKSFLTRVEKNPPKDLQKAVVEIDKAVWEETDCLSCGNCCKKMTPTFTPKDIKRIAQHLEMKPLEFRDKYLVFEKKDGDWQNKTQPCQFIDKVDNKCSIYAVRPADCSGFPHLTKKNMVDYIHVHKQNVSYCPATYKMVEMMRENLVLLKK
ncbi:MAG: YkgJ family cysteine cluster protein [Sphingobacteriales bacterium]|nr:YkgJ family cysteine cluster protein [Sphingobacteriales bacterium]